MMHFHSFKSVVTVLLALLQIAFAAPKPNLGPQYYGETVYESDGTTLTTLVPVSLTPIYASTWSTATTSTTFSTATTYATTSSTTASVVPVPYVYAVTMYYTTTSFYTTYSTTASTATGYETYTGYTTSYSASTTTSYPVCSGTLTETTTIMIEAGPTYVLGTTFVSALVLETYYISGTSTTTDFYTTTTSYYIPGPPHPQVTTAPTIIHTGPHTLTYPCETITVTETQSYEPVVQTNLEIRQTIVTSLYSSESYTTTRSTEVFASSTTATLEFTYTSTYLATAPADVLTESGSNNASSVTTVTPATLTVVYATTTTSDITFATTSSETFAETFHITAGFGFTSTYLLGSGTTLETTTQTYVAAVTTTASESATSTGSLPSATYVSEGGTNNVDVIWKLVIAGTFLLYLA